MYTVRAIKDGNEQAFKFFYESMYDQVYHFVSKRSRNTLEIKDLVQEIFIKIWENRHTLTNESSLKALAFTIARNLIIDHYRKGLLQEKYLVNTTPSAYDIPYEDATVDNSFPQSLQLVQEEIEKLPDQRKTIFKLNKYNGWTIEEIADELSLSKRTVENHLYRATKSLRTKLSKLISLFF